MLCYKLSDMKKNLFCIWSLCLGLSVPVLEAQNKAMTVDDLLHWQRISARAISDDGKWVTASFSPWEGDATLFLYDAEGREVHSFAPAGKSRFAASSDFLVVQLLPAKETLDSLKLSKVKPEKLPMNRLTIFGLKGTSSEVDSVRTYEMSEVADWLAFQSGRKDSTLHVRSLNGQQVFTFPKVSSFRFAEKSAKLYFVTKGSESLTAGLYTFDPISGQSRLQKEGRGEFKQMTFDKSGDHLAFLYCEQKDSVYKAMDLWWADTRKTDGARQAVTRATSGMPAGWVISQHAELSFSKDGKRLYFATSPEPMQKDTTVLDVYRPNVQVWSWNEPVQYTVQNYNKEKDLKKNYQAVYFPETGKMVQLADISLPDCQLGDEGNASYALLSTSEPYSLSSMWEGRTRRDYYRVSVETGERQLLSRADYARMRLSPQGKYAYWYAETDSSWYAATLETGKINRLTSPDSFVAWDEENDVPDYPEAYGMAGWTADDASLWIYDRFDIWQVDPEGLRPMQNLTRTGRSEQTAFAWVKLDPEQRYINEEESQLLKGFNRQTKETGYYRWLPGKGSPEPLLQGKFMLSLPVKAKQADRVIFSRESFEKFPELEYADLKFRNPLTLTHGGDQQKPFRWGTAELVHWRSLDGKELEGVVYKPADFDPSRKYPLIVNFYERNSETLYKYRMPEPHRSTVDYRLYNSNEYVIFNPDVRYEDGYPGESCYNCVMPGIMQLLSEGYIDEKAIAAQGHSWGGYQVAYLATRTRLFAAIESGAPVVNMFSAYGGIRWGSGLARSFQYEHTQSRIGGTPWSMPEQYRTNSPLFAMDKVETPILIMHNDADGHVPWYQGIEYFVAMKRLGKPCWLLNYTGEPHWPMRMANQVDFQKRMFQFFNHFLKKEPMPHWMSEGVKAVEQPYSLGY